MKETWEGFKVAHKQAGVPVDTETPKPTELQSKEKTLISITHGPFHHPPIILLYASSNISETATAALRQCA